MHLQGKQGENVDVIEYIGLMPTTLDKNAILSANPKRKITTLKKKNKLSTI